MPARRSARIEKNSAWGGSRRPFRAPALSRGPARAQRRQSGPPTSLPRPALALGWVGSCGSRGGPRRQVGRALDPTRGILGATCIPSLDLRRITRQPGCSNTLFACNTRIVGATRILGRATRQPCSGNTLLCAAVAGPRLAPVTPLSLWRVRRWPARTLSWAHGSAACSSSSATHSLSPRSAALCSAVLPSCGPPVALPHGNAY